MLAGRTYRSDSFLPLHLQLADERRLLQMPTVGTRSFFVSLRDSRHATIIVRVNNDIHGTILEENNSNLQKPRFDVLMSLA